MITNEEHPVTGLELFVAGAVLIHQFAPEFRDRFTCLLDIVPVLLCDLAAYVEKDPAANGSQRLVAEEYFGFQAVLHHRVAHALMNSGCQDKREKSRVQAAARRISEAGKLKTGVEIHPGAVIGPGFVLDHGLCTVIGETAVIGKNVTILNNVMLGSRRAARNPDGKRHPTIKDDVEIGCYVQILGPVTVGTGSRIGAGCLIVDDVEPDSRIAIQARVQITKRKGQVTSEEDAQQRNTVERVMDNVLVLIGNCRLWFHNGSVRFFKYVNL